MQMIMGMTCLIILISFYRMGNLFNFIHFHQNIQITIDGCQTYFITILIHVLENFFGCYMSINRFKII